MMKVVWFKRAIWDLRSVQAYIAQDNPQAARETVNQIVSLLSEQPGIGRPGRVPNTKELIIDHTPFILPYRVRDNRVEILGVLHTSRKWPNKL
ncbi:type II toxin-antitoxin system RelE/ParE family toxin [Pseudomonadota bacterium]